MNLKLLMVLLLVAVAAAPTGCASSKETADDSTTPVLEAAQSPDPVSHDDSHGWGANVQGMDHK